MRMSLQLVWCLVLVISALRRPRQDRHHVCKASLGYIVSETLSYRAPNWKSPNAHLGFVVHACNGRLLSMLFSDTPG